MEEMIVAINDEGEEKTNVLAEQQKQVLEKNKTLIPRLRDIMEEVMENYRDML